MKAPPFAPPMGTLIIVSGRAKAEYTPRSPFGFTKTWGYEPFPIPYPAHFIGYRKRYNGRKTDDYGWEPTEAIWMVLTRTDAWAPVVETPFSELRSELRFRSEIPPDVDL